MSQTGSAEAFKARMLACASLPVVLQRRVQQAGHGGYQRYLRDHRLFLSNNTDGPGNLLSKVYSRRTGSQLFSAFSEARTNIRFLNLRAYPGGERLSKTRPAERLGRRWGWHL